MKAVLIGLVVGFSSLLCVAFPTEMDSDNVHVRFPPTVLRKGNPENGAAFWFDKAARDLRKRKSFASAKKAKNLIFFLGDGMSVATLTAARILQAERNNQSLGQSEPLSFENFLFSGLSRTYCLDYEVADSACSATAYLCGVKGNMATIGVNGKVTQRDAKASADKRNQVESLAYFAQKAGKATGFVTNTRVTHASPAGNYAHIAERNWENDDRMERDRVDSRMYEDIAEQLILREPGKNFNVIMGGGRKNFLPRDKTASGGAFERGWRLDNVNLINEWREDKRSRKSRGYEYVSTRDQLLSLKETPSFLLGLFASEHMAEHYLMEETQPTLEEMTEEAIKVLQKEGGEKGFFLWVEGGKLDLAHHVNQAHVALDETIELSKAVAKAVSMTDEEDTLVVVTADHSHTMTLNGYAPVARSIFGFAGMARDKLPYMSLSYANGVGYVGRKNLTRDETKEVDYTFPAGLPLRLETHGGDDVAVFASGPNAELFSGSYDQSYIPHAMAFAADLKLEIVN